jgi:hypothetical protein
MTASSSAESATNWFRRRWGLALPMAPNLVYLPHRAPIFRCAGASAVLEQVSCKLMTAAGARLAQASHGLASNILK